MSVRSAPLRAPEALDLEAVAGLLPELSGRPVRRVVADGDAWVDGLVGHGVPAASAQMLLKMFRASRRGEVTVTNGALEDLLGREPTSMRTVLAGVVSARWRGGGSGPEPVLAQ